MEGGAEGRILDPEKCTQLLQDQSIPLWKRAAWIIAMLIPPGYAATYKALAELLETHPRRIAAAMKTNPCPIIIPCHRIVASRGLGGYTPAGREFKKKLLALEADKGETKRIMDARQLEQLAFPDPSTLNT